MSRDPLSKLYGQLQIWQHRLPVGSEWRHYKGDVYEIVGHGIAEATGEVEIVYKRSAVRTSRDELFAIGQYPPGALNDIPFHRAATKWEDEVKVQRGQTIPAEVIEKLSAEEKLRLANDHINLPRFRRVVRVENFIDVQNA